MGVKGRGHVSLIGQELQSDSLTNTPQSVNLQVVRALEATADPSGRDNGRRKRESVFACRRHSRRGDGANLNSSSSDGIFLALDQANARSQRRQIGTKRSFMLPDLTGNHVRHLDDSTVLPVIRTRADIAKARPPDAGQRPPTWKSGRSEWSFPRLRGGRCTGPAARPRDPDSPKSGRRFRRKCNPHPASDSRAVRATLLCPSFGREPQRPVDGGPRRIDHGCRSNALL
jgi:hypothetical protein